MDGYTDSTYGDAFADVYDDWYQGISDVDTTVDLLAELAGEFAPLPVLELGVGTGRLAVPLAARGVAGRRPRRQRGDARQARRERSDGIGCARCLGDMVDDQPTGPFALVFVAYNTFFNLLTEARQRACFAAVAERLVPGGAFVIEAFVPEPHPGSSVDVRSMTADSVVLSSHHARRGDTDRAGSVHLVQRVGWRANAAVGDSLRDGRATRRDGDRRLDFVSTIDGKTLNVRRSPPTVHVTSVVYRTIHSPVRPEGSATS